MLLLLFASGAVAKPAIQPFPVYGFAPDTRSQRYRRIDLRKYIKREEKREEEAPAETPLKQTIRRASVRSELRSPLYFPVVYRPEPIRQSRPDPARWAELFIAVDNAHRRYKQLQEEEDIAFVMSILAAM